MKPAYDHTDALRSPMLQARAPLSALEEALLLVYCSPGPDGWQPRGMSRALEVARGIDCS